MKIQAQKTTVEIGDHIELRCHTELGDDIHFGTVQSALPFDTYIVWEDNGEAGWYRLRNDEKNSWSVVR